MVIEISSDLAAIQTTILKPQNAVYQGLMSRVNMDQRQRLGLDFHSNTKECGRLKFDPEKGHKEIIPPWWVGFDPRQRLTCTFVSLANEAWLVWAGAPSAPYEGSGWSCLGFFEEHRHNRSRLNPHMFQMRGKVPGMSHRAARHWAQIWRSTCTAGSVSGDSTRTTMT